MATKIDHINRAYCEMRISGITVKPTPQHLFTGLQLLEDMFAELADTRGVCIGYNFEEEPDANTESGLTRSANNMAGTNLAVRLLAAFNKSVPPSLYALAKSSMSGVVGKAVFDRTRQVQAPGRMPVGSGYRYRNRHRRFERPEDLAPNTCSTNRINVGEINDYQSSFHGYLKGELIQSFTIASSTGIEIISSSISSTVEVINYRVKGLRPRESHQHVIITIETDSGRIEQRIINFEIKTGDDTAASQVDANGNDLLGSSLLGNTQLGG